jgi:hypothetical protein
MDRTVLLWRCVADAGGWLWLSEASLGEVAAGTALGYFDAVFAPDGAAIAAHGFTGVQPGPCYSMGLVRGTVL